jgi:hypothetical protein
MPNLILLLAGLQASKTKNLANYGQDPPLGDVVRPRCPPS